MKMTHKHIQTKADTDELCETTQPRRQIRALRAPWVLSTAGNLLRYLHGSYLLPDRNPAF